MSDGPSPAGARPLEPDRETVARWLEAAKVLVLDHLDGLETAPAGGVEGALDRLDELVEPLPEDGAELTGLLERVVRDWVPASFNTAGPGYLAYIPGGGIVPSAIADLVADVTNRYVGVFAAAPLLARLEMTAIRWLGDLFDQPPGMRGVLTSGGSIANLIALVCARHDRLGERFDDGVVYVSGQVHHSVEKAATFVGFPRARVRRVETDASLRLDPERLRAAIAADRRAGLRPAIVVASAGTTNTGTVDDHVALADVARDEGVWLHSDAAYGGAFAMTDRGRRALAGIERSDSITVDPHKGLFLPYGTGCLLVRDGEKLAAPHRSEAGYLPPMQDPEIAQDFCETSPELSREFRGLRLWLPLKTFGARAFRAALDEKLDLAARAAETLAAEPTLHLVQAPHLSLVAFRWDDGRGRSPDELDERNRELLRRVLAHGEVWLSGAWVEGRFTQRICVLSFRTHAEHVDRAVARYVEEARALGDGGRSVTTADGS